jgi:cell division septation protein DedD
MSYGGKRGAGERVLEGRHVIGLFLAVTLLSGLFFTLGYVLGRNESQGQVNAADLPKPDRGVSSKPEAGSPKHAGKDSPAGAPAGTETGAPASSDWEFYRAGENKKPEDRLKPAAPTTAPAAKSAPLLVKTTTPAHAANAGAKHAAAPAAPAGGYSLQVAALIKESDALEIARQLQKKKFPAYVLSPHGDKYFRVQVGPYADQKAADAARKGVEAAGFKAFVKR